MALRRVRSLLRTACVAFGVVLVTSGVAAAGQPTGVWSLIDTQQYPAVTCYFHNVTTDDYLYRISTRAPIVYAVDRTTGRDSQSVAWQARLQGYDYTNSVWVPLWKSKWVTRTATDAYNAQWPAWAVSAPIDSSLFQTYSAFRVRVAIRWDHPGSTSSVDSSLVATPQYYVDHYGGQDHEFVSSCGDTLG